MSHDQLYRATRKAHYQPRNFSEIEVWGELPSGITLTISAERVEDELVDETIDLARKALLDLHCERIDSEIN